MYHLYLNTLKKVPVHFVKGFWLGMGASAADDVYPAAKTQINWLWEQWKFPKQEKSPEQPSSNNKKPKN
ncbi:MAG: hypothetical protein WC748_08760 [Legionellales bacterium]|jgi:hypothetical protein